MRTIKFRGKDIETGEWLYGDLIQRMGYMPTIVHSVCDNGKVAYVETAVQRESVGQFTGVCDEYGNEIYEGDIVADEYWDELPRQVFWDKRFCRYGCIHPSTNGFLALFDYEKPNILGNIHDNPELLNE